MGKKIKTEMAQQRSRFVEGAVEQRRRSRQRRVRSSSWWPSSPATASTRSHAAAYALIAYQTAYLKANYPVEFLAASMTLDIGNTDKLSGFAPGGAAHGHHDRAAVGQPLRGRFPAEDGAIRYSLAALQECRPPGGRAYLSPNARSDGRFKDVSRFRPRASIRASSTSGRWRRSPPPARSTRSARPAHGASPMSIASWPPATDRLRTRPAARTTCSPARRARRRRSSCRAAKPWVPTDRLAARIRGGRLLPLRPSARRLPGRARGARRRDLGGLRGEGPHRGASSARSPAPSSRRERQRKTATPSPSSPSPIRPASSRRWCSPKRLAASRDCLSPAAPCCSTSRPRPTGRPCKVRPSASSSLEAAAEARHSGIKIYLERHPRAQVHRRTGGRPGRAGRAEAGASPRRCRTRGRVRAAARRSTRHAEADGARSSCVDGVAAVSAL